jgi:hypothetical protein
MNLPGGRLETDRSSSVSVPVGRSHFLPPSPLQPPSHPPPASAAVSATSSLQTPSLQPHINSNPRFCLIATLLPPIHTHTPPFLCLLHESSGKMTFYKHEGKILIAHVKANEHCRAGSACRMRHASPAVKHIKLVQTINRLHL